MDRLQSYTTTTGLHNEADTRTPAPVTTWAALMMPWWWTCPGGALQTYPSYCDPEWLHWPEIWQSPQLNCSLPRPAQVGRCQCNVYHCIRPSRAFLIIWLGSESLLSAGHSGHSEVGSWPTLSKSKIIEYFWRLSNWTIKTSKNYERAQNNI